ncbi:WG repeat-containing protein [Psychrobacter sp.]|uniref:WG repeat-containing protein n=1 Tax=Psychrobacter sp. TaxID=56811 RepID=UPI0025D7EBB8|nr:WG repeat-containing protein [Psychrobacter sp.]
MNKAVWILATLATISLPAYACQVPKSYYTNVFCTASSDYFLALKDSAQPVALIDKKGRRVADLMRYNNIDVSKLKEGLVPVQRLGRVGYIDVTGREVIPAIYDIISGDNQTKGWSRAVSNNRIVVKKGGSFGVIDTKNRIIIPFSADNLSISDFRGDSTSINTRNGPKWVDINGRPTANPLQVIPSRKSTMTALGSNSTSSTSKPAAKTAPVIQSTSTPSTSAPVASSPKSNSEIWQPEQRDGKWGFVNRGDVPMIKFLFEQVTPFSEGLAGVRMENKWGFVNLAGELVIPFNYEESKVSRQSSTNYKGVQPFQFTNGKAWVANNANGDQICIDIKGSYVSCS